MDHRTNQNYPVPMLMSLTTTSDGDIIMTRTKLIDLERDDVYSSMTDVPAEDVETTLKTLRTFRKAFVEMGDLETDLLFGRVQSVLMFNARRRNAHDPNSTKSGDVSHACATTGPATTQRPDDETHSYDG